MTLRTFPTGFLWGAATAGHQVEGHNVSSDTWFAENVNPTVFAEKSGAACGSYDRWSEDIDLAVGMGLNAYRFSVEWARVEPSPGVFAQDELDHYEAIVDRCRAHGLAPMLTFNQFTLPHWFAARGSWLDPEAPQLFARYCAVVSERFGSRLAIATTLTEPNLPQLLTWIDLPDAIANLSRATLAACGLAAGVPRYRLSNVILPEEMEAMSQGMEAGHRAGKAAIKSVCPDLPVGFGIAIMDDQVVGDDSSVRDRKREEVYGRWLRLAREDDFVGVQNYETIWYDGQGVVPPHEGVDLTGLGSEIAPRSLHGAVSYAHERTGVPVLVTEHGLENADDSLRAAFIPAALEGLLDAIDEGVPVLGYTHWSLLDNFEWIFGYSKFYGLHSVDRRTFERTAKPSAAVFAAIAAANGIDM